MMEICISHIKRNIRGLASYETTFYRTIWIACLKVERTNHRSDLNRMKREPASWLQTSSVGRTIFVYMSSKQLEYVKMLE